MSKKGIDSHFLHYGIRKGDMQHIDTLCEKHGVDADWLRENVLKTYHERKIRNKDLDEKNLKKVLEKALTKIN